MMRLKIKSRAIIKPNERETIMLLKRKRLRKNMLGRRPRRIGLRWSQKPIEIAKSMMEIPTCRIGERLPRITNSFSLLSKKTRSQNLDLFNSTMASLTKESGRWECERAMGLKPGLMAANTSDSGEITRQMARESCTIPMEMSMKVNG